MPFGPPLQPRRSPSHPGPGWECGIQTTEDENEETRRGVHDCLGPEGAGREKNKADATHAPGWRGDPEGLGRPAYLPSAIAWRE